VADVPRRRRRQRRYRPTLSGAIDAATVHLVAAEERGDPTVAAAFRQTLVDLERLAFGWRLP
jgi:hypothetical protein